MTYKSSKSNSRLFCLLMKNIFCSAGTLLSLSALFACVIPALGAPYNVKQAFCIDKLNIEKSNYDNAIIFNDCMRNADRLIREMENQRRREEEEWRKNEPVRRKQAEHRRKEWERKEMQKKKAREAAKQERIRKNNELNQKYDQLFDNF